MPDSCVEKLKVLADETRLSVLEALMNGPRHVGELSDSLGVEQSLLSHHLRVLREARLVESNRDGKGVLYSVAPGVKSDATQKAINLGCCELTFTPLTTRKRT